MKQGKIFLSGVLPGLPRHPFVIICAAVLSVLFLHSCSTFKTSGERFRFIFCNDIHYRGGQDNVMLSKVLNEWKTDMQHWDFLVVAGDLTNYGELDKMDSVKKHLDRLQKPYYPIIGNHDVTAPGDEGKKNYFTVFGQNHGNHVIMHKNVCLLFLDLSNGRRTWVPVTVSTKLWLKKTLAFIPKKTPIIVFSHFPLHPDSPRFAVVNATELFELLDDHNVLAYFSGHYHGNWTGMRNNIPFFTNVRLLPNREAKDEYPGSGYLVVDVHHSSVAVSFRETTFGRARPRYDEGQLFQD